MYRAVRQTSADIVERGDSALVYVDNLAEQLGLLTKTVRIAYRFYLAFLRQLREPNETLIRGFEACRRSRLADLSYLEIVAERDTVNPRHQLACRTRECIVKPLGRLAAEVLERNKHTISKYVPLKAVFAAARIVLGRGDTVAAQMLDKHALPFGRLPVAGHTVKQLQHERRTRFDVKPQYRLAVRVLTVGHILDFA